MRILHTSDWHLGARLRHIPRQPHIKARLLEIASYLQEHAVDVLVVAGDLFHKKHHRTDELREAVEDLREVFRPFLLRGGTMVVISGNHDHEVLFELLHMAQDMAAPAEFGDEPRPGGRLYLAARPGLLRLADRAGQQVQFALLPYPTTDRYLDGEEASVGSPEERHARLQRGLLRRLEKICARLRPEMPSVLVSHTHVRGSRLHNLYELELRDDVVFETAHLPERFAYAAYGHIHLAQALADAEHIRYSGSIERLDKGEREDEKSVVLLDVTRGGTVRPQLLPLRATPIACCTVSDPERDLQVLVERYPDRETILYYALDMPRERDRDAVHRELRRLFPNALREDPPEARSGGGAHLDGEAPALTARLRDLRGTVTSYLEEHLGGPGKERALGIAARLIDEIEEQERREALSPDV